MTGWLAAFAERDREWSWQVFLWADQGGGLAISFFTFLLLGRGSVWNADETISSRVGRNALLRKRWALAAQAAIDRIFAPFEERHCLNSIEWALLDAAARARLEAMMTTAELGKT